MIFKCKKGKKKMALVLATLLTVLFVSSLVYADAGMGRFSNNQNVKMVVVVNNSATELASAAVSTSTITVPHHRILGYCVAPYNASSVENWVSLFDTDSTASLNTTTVFTESEAATGRSETVWFPYPKALTTGLWIRQGPRTIVTIYYEDKREI